MLDGEEFSSPDVGAAQGSALSPLLGNVYLHHVLDLWFEREVRPRLSGRATLIRHADDFIVGRSARAPRRCDSGATRRAARGQLSTGAKQHLEAGYRWVVDLDLEKFFDRVNHQRLLARLEQRVEDRRLIRLIGMMLKAKVVMPDGVVVSNDEGAQGGPLSPLLSNIVLDELDWELQRRGHHFVRHADDCNVYVSSERAGRRVMASVYGDHRSRWWLSACPSANRGLSKAFFVEQGLVAVEFLWEQRVAEALIVSGQQELSWG